MTTSPSADSTNTRLVAQCLAGDERAWHILLERYKYLIYAIPLRHGASPEEAADIFQAVCTDLYDELPRLSDAETLQGWLIRVTTNKCRDLKKQTGNASDGERPAVADIIADVEREQMVREAMADLPDRCRELIELLFFENPPLPYEDVAQRLKLEKGSVEFFRGSCLKKLKKLLDQRGF